MLGSGPIKKNDHFTSIGFGLKVIVHDVLIEFGIDILTWAKGRSNVVGPRELEDVESR